MLDKLKDVFWFCKYAYNGLLADTQKFKLKRIHSHLLDNYADIWSIK